MPLDRSRIQAILFDIDGTLSDTDDLFVARLSGWLQPARFLFPGSDVRRFARWAVMATENPGTFLMGIPDRLGLDGLLIAAGDWLYQTGLGGSSRPFQLVPGVAPLLTALAKHYPLAVVTARRERIARRFLDQFELVHTFKAVAAAQTCPHTKPYPDPVLWAAARLGVLPENCLMVGDTSVDIFTGKAAGAQTVGVLCGFGEEPELRAAGADMILPSPVDLEDILLKN